jgi:hypothetical protein
MAFIIMQQVMPGIIIALMQSQQAWIIFSQFLSPDMQVIMQPMSVISILHMPIIPMLQQQQHMPFIIMQHETIPPAIMLHRFCTIMAAVLSLQVQVIFMPPAHFSIFIMQRGIIMPGMFMPDMLEDSGIIIGIIPIMGMPIIPPPIPMLDIRSLVIVVFILSSTVLPAIRAGFLFSASPPAPCKQLSTGHNIAQCRGSRQGKPAFCPADYARRSDTSPFHPIT